VDLLPGGLSFRVVNTLDVADDAEIPDGFTGRVRRRFANGQSTVSWLQDGVLHDPTRGEPAFRVMRRDGAVKYEMHYSVGLLHDPDGKTPAVRGYFTNGRVHYEERYRAGRRQDGPKGVAAVRKWRADGTLRHELHYVLGARQY
jgi:hypothetical protein